MKSSTQAALGAASSSEAQAPHAVIEWWWRVFDIRVGSLPLPVYVLMLGVLGAMAAKGKLAADLPTGIALVAVGGFTCAELAKRIPWIRHIGATSIFAAFIPSMLVYYKLMPEPVVKAVTTFTKTSNFLYLFIAAIIVGSVLSMDRQMLIKGFVRIFIPVAAGSVAAALVGTAVGTALGLDTRHALFMVVVPIMAGGVGEGALPLSAGYAQILGVEQGPLFAQVLSAVMLGNIAAICCAGLLSYLGTRRPEWTGNGRLTKADGSDEDIAQRPASFEFDVGSVAAAGSTAIAFYLLGVLSHQLFGWPAPVVMLVLVVAAQLFQVVSPRVRGGARFMYGFFSTAVTYPLMFAISVAMTPWGEIVTAFHWVNIVTAVSTVLALTVTGFFVGRLVGMYPVEAAIVNATHSGLGGTGDVAILTAANRMELMPFAQIATRIGGALTVTAALGVFAYWR
ncbi:2-hydroxycarboxylate transporter family protein [Paraburkholderia hospita]|uniref:Citrate/malate transporter n=1 Tax=Paraburkholderia hospita TaxID=169430 RepID=A0AAN1J7R8_9BURK|nr:2-hydroxycarboxylate transporter family protein [Paraburkholderia hospita]AUT68791.1 malate permease [Paraburkholderia hospita]EIM95765.1 putative citrate/malate transporter [Paraburkholderia hospita]OUL71885.1 malate permease [Paraburkholderia hospita]OUL81015.1 malate permease [Paraburkholderia hospita]SEI20511.1 citrate carrier protein, CCS family [Paraburkholderia hospita]